MKTGLIILGGVLLLGGFGCAPRLAQTPLGSEELRWEKYLKQCYPAWKPPQTAPPVLTGNGTPVPESGNDIDITVDTQVSGAELPAAPPVANPPATLAAPAASTAPVAVTPPPAKPTGRSYTVQKGDTLSSISVKMYHSSKEVNRIIQANSKLIKNKNRIYPGMTLVIPAL